MSQAIIRCIGGWAVCLRHLIVLIVMMLTRASNMYTLSYKEGR